MAKCLIWIMALCWPWILTAQSRQLSQAEEDSLTDFASKNGANIWYLERAQAFDHGAREKAHAVVIFEPANRSDYCLARAVEFETTSTNGAGIGQWHFSADTEFHYRFWYQPCGIADAAAAIRLTQLIDLNVLHQLRDRQYSIVSDAVRILEQGRQHSPYATELSAFRLTAVNIAYDPDHGMVYRPTYSLNRCQGLIPHLVVAPAEVEVVRAYKRLC